MLRVDRAEKWMSRSERSYRALLFMRGGDLEASEFKWHWFVERPETIEEAFDFGRRIGADEFV
ncbi:MAG: hypothetical protein EOR72_31110 [Mesorhizobium sp.]|uniref:hypothetical protein n=1 Tax=Mesorhizobium sp. TaxID=1871066 RepID=UPI000FE81293|nr:hypothetical protein [Mesorhizobium sp.]RWM06850.1 MAG: hypothetical protein EOR72_31110 [Mesorhizobium sp.]